MCWIPHQDEFKLILVLGLSLQPLQVVWRDFWVKWVVWDWKQNNLNASKEPRAGLEEDGPRKGLLVGHFNESGGEKREMLLKLCFSVLGVVWYGKVFICIVISEFVCGGVQILYQKCLMTLLCRKPHVKAEGLCSPLQPAVNIKYLKSAADNVIYEFSPCIPGLMLKGSLQYSHYMYIKYIVSI